MCQVEEDDLDHVGAKESCAILDEKESKSIADWKCNKCGEQAVIHLRDEDAKCGKCFRASVTQKFRAVLSKYQISKSRDSVLVAVSGGAASAALLGLLREIKSKQPKLSRNLPKLRHTRALLHESDICQGISSASSMDSRTHDLRAVLNMVKSIGPDWRFLHSSVETVFAAVSTDLFRDGNADGGTEIHTTDVCSHHMLQLLEATKSSTAKEEMLKLLRWTLLRMIGRHLNITKALVGDTVDRLAVQLITNTALGRGKHLPTELGYLDTRDPHFTVVRPLKEISLKEVIMFNELCDIPVVQLDCTQVGTDQKTSIYQMTKAFVDGVQKDFPQTATTLCKTGDKLCSTGIVKAKAVVGDKHCSFCSGPMDSSDVGSCTAENSIALSLSLSSPQRPVDLEDLPIKACVAKNDCNEKGGGDGCGSDGGGCCSSNTKTDSVTANPVCYSCRWMLSEIKNVNLLPPRLLEDASQRHRRKEMRENIKDFLLVDDEDAS